MARRKKGHRRESRPAGPPMARTTARKAADQTKDTPPERQRRVSFPIVGIGASAGGVEALTHLLRALPPDTGMAFVVVFHLCAPLLWAAHLLRTVFLVSCPDEGKHIRTPPPRFTLTSGAF